MKKIKNFFENNKAGKLIGSVLLGVGNVLPITAPFMPAIKSAATGIAGKDKHDIVAYAAAIGTIIIIILVAMGKIDLETAKALDKMID